MKVLFIYDDIWHPAEVIDRGLKSFGNQLEGMEFDMVMCAKDILTPEMIRMYDVIVSAKGNAINASNVNPWFEETVTEVMPRDFEAYVREGGSFLALHAANAVTEKGCKEYTDFVGCSFVTHPLRCMVHYEPVGNHPVLEGVGPFSQRDEHYIVDLQEGVVPFLKSTSEPGGEHVAGYEKTIGKGKVLSLMPGHTLAVWQDPDFQKLLVNCIRYLGNKVSE